MKWLLLLSIYFITQQRIVACWCDSIKPLTAKTWQDYDNIALVKVMSLEPITLNFAGNELPKAQFTVAVIENFKSDLPDKFLLDSYNTSCDTGLRPGEEWIMFTKNINGYSAVLPCDHSFKYKDKNGLKDFRYHEGDQFLDHIRHLAGRPVNVKDGLIEELYPNRQKAYTELYKNGKLEGERLVWHSNGTLWGREFYGNGQQNGTSIWWYANGMMERKDKFDKGIQIDTSWSWYEIETDSIDLRMHRMPEDIPPDSVKQIYGRRQLLNTTVYGQGGQRLYSKSYHRNGKLNYEAISYTENTLIQTTYYSRYGAIKSIVIRNDKMKQSVYELSFNEDGTQRAFYYDAKGRLLRRTLVKEGVETIEEQKEYPDK